MSFNRIMSVAAIAVSFAATAKAQDRAIATSRGELDGLEIALKALSADVDTPEAVDKQALFSRRLNDAEILFLLNDPMRASLILYDAVDVPEAKRYRFYDEAVFYLAESLFMMRHDFAARDRFQDLVRRRSSQYTNIAVQRLIQIADRTGRYDGIEDHVNALRMNGPLPPEVGYIWAKSQVTRGQAEAAKQTAAGVPPESRLWAKARYMSAVAEVQLGRYGEARTIFEQLSTIGNNYEEAQTIRDLAAMDRGRILLDQGDLVTSVDSYQRVERTGPLFDESLYEATWSYIRAADVAKDDDAKAAEYLKAQRALEILLLSNSENALVPEARLLYGNILIKLARFDEATIAFQQVVDRYQPARTELTTMMTTETDAHVYYDEVVARAKMGDTSLSPVVLTWARSEKPLQDAMRVSGDLDQSDLWLDESTHLIDDLLQVLDSNRRSTFFPEIRDQQARAFEIEDQLTQVNQKLLEIHRDIAEDHLDNANEKELDDTMRELATLDAEYRALPKRREDVESRIVERNHVMAVKGRDVFRLGFELESMRTGVKALNQWFSQNSRLMGVEERNTVRDRIDQQTAEIEELEKQHRALAAELETTRQMVAVTAHESHELQVRDRYEALLNKERAILETATPRLDKGERALLDQLNAQRDRAARDEAELQNDAAKLDSDMSGRVAQLKVQVLKERVNLESLRETSKLTRVDTERAVGDVARATIGTVADKFKDIVLRADVGVVDVAWQVKEQQTSEINRRVAEQRRELEVLDSEFKEVLAE